MMRQILESSLNSVTPALSFWWITLIACWVRTSKSCENSLKSTFQSLHLSIGTNEVETPKNLMKFETSNPVPGIGLSTGSNGYEFSKKRKTPISGPKDISTAFSKQGEYLNELVFPFSTTPGLSNNTYHQGSNAKLLKKFSLNYSSKYIFCFAFFVLKSQKVRPIRKEVPKFTITDLKEGLEEIIKSVKKSIGSSSPELDSGDLDLSSADQVLQRTFQKVVKLVKRIVGDKIFELKSPNSLGWFQFEGLNPDSSRNVRDKLMKLEKVFELLKSFLLSCDPKRPTSILKNHNPRLEREKTVYLMLEYLIKFELVELHRIQKFFSNEAVIQATARHLYYKTTRDYAGIAPVGYHSSAKHMLERDKMTSHLHRCLSIFGEKEWRLLLHRFLSHRINFVRFDNLQNELRAESDGLSDMRTSMIMFKRREFYDSLSGDGDMGPARKVICSLAHELDHPTYSISSAGYVYNQGLMTLLQWVLSYSISYSTWDLRRSLDTKINLQFTNVKLKLLSQIIRLIFMTEEDLGRLKTISRKTLAVRKRLALLRELFKRNYSGQKTRAYYLLQELFHEFSIEELRSIPPEIQQGLIDWLTQDRNVFVFDYLWQQQWTAKFKTQLRESIEPKLDR